MASSILPNDKCTSLPITPTDGQRFIDAQMVQWIYNARLGVWERSGTAENIPLATVEEDGLLSPQDKNLLDKVPAVGGGFGIITDTKLVLQSPTNPEGVVTGDITLRSESLDIICVGPDRLKLECTIPPELECTTANNNLPGLSFKLSSKFLDNLLVDLRGEKGKTGDDGDKGDQGDPGFSDGPQGDEGQQGDTINELCELNNITYNDIDGITDTAIVDFNAIDDNGHGCKLIVTKAKINVPGDRASDKIIAQSTSRSVVYDPDTDPVTCDLTRLSNWRLSKPTGDSTLLNLQLLRLSKGSNSLDSPTGFNGTMTLEGFVTDIVSEYQDRLTQLDLDWGKEVKSYIETIDNKARGILSSLANDLAMCEFELPAVEYCITFTGCGQPAPPPPPSPSIAAASRAGKAPMRIGSQKVARIGMGKRSWNVKQ